MQKFVRFTFALVFAGFVALGAARADVPSTLNYQGTLTDNTGQPVNGSRTITFRLYDVPTGGTAFWTETQTINLVDGRLSVVLGGNPIDPKKFTGQTYVGIQVAPDTEMPRQKFTSVAYAFKAADAIPKGVIVMWSGAVADIPAGWALCNGSNGTPDLRDRFIVGAGSGYSPGNTGGTNTNNISHTHSITAESPGTSGVGDHQHSFSGKTGYPDADKQKVDETEQESVAGDDHRHDYSGTTSPAGSHSHTVNSHSHGGSTGAGGSASLDNRPLYFALVFIMKL